MNYHNFNVQLKYEYMKSKDCNMWIYYDVNGFYPYEYIHKLYDKPTKKIDRFWRSECLRQCKLNQYWDEM